MVEDRFDGFYVNKEFQDGYDDVRLERGWNDPWYLDKDGKKKIGNQVSYEYGRQFFAFFGDKFQLRDRVSSTHAKVDVLYAFEDQIMIRRSRQSLPV